MTRRRWWIALAVAVLVIGGIYYFATGGPLLAERIDGGHRRAMLSMVPADVEDVVVVPEGGSVFRQLRRNPMTEPSVEDWIESQSLEELPLLLGRAEVVFWRSAGGSGFIAAPDPIRAFLAKHYLRGGQHGDVVVDHGFLVSGRGVGALDAPSVSNIIGLAGGMRAHLFAVQFPSSHFAYPPGGRPAVTGVMIGDDNIHLESRSPAVRPRELRNAPESFPGNALIAGSIDPTSEAPRLLKSLPGAASDLVARAGGVIIYSVDDRKFFPRIHGILLFPDSDSDFVLGTINHPLHRNFLDSIGATNEEKRVVKGTEIIRRRGLGYTIETASRDGQLLLAFDKDSIETFLGDGEVVSPWPGKKIFWSARFRPDLLLPVLDKLRDREELKLVSPDLYRDVGRAGEWSRWISGAESAWVMQTGNGSIDSTSALVTARSK